MKQNSNISTFLAKGATVFFAKGTDNSTISASNIGKLAIALSLAGAVSLSTPATAEARGGGVMLGLIGGMALGSMITRAPAQNYYPQQNYQPQPSYYPQQSYQPQVVIPVNPYGQNNGYQNNGGGRPGLYYCPRGPQQQCYWKHGALEIKSDNKLAELDVDAPSFKMG